MAAFFTPICSAFAAISAGIRASSVELPRLAVISPTSGCGPGHHPARNYCPRNGATGGARRKNARRPRAAAAGRSGSESLTNRGGRTSNWAKEELTMKKMTMLVTVLLALAPGLATAQQPPQPPQAPQAPAAPNWRPGPGARARLAARAPFAGRMAWQGRWAGVPGRGGFGQFRGQAWGPMQQFQRQGRGMPGAMMGRRMARPGGMMGMGMPGEGMGMPGQGMGMQGPGRGMGMPGQGGPLGPLADPRIRQQLNLTDAQVKQLDELRASVQAERQKQMVVVRAELQKQMEQVRAARQK
ncbi:MAG: hypothetical protein FIB01_01720, partial [Gemmatimonadetes bacterium]|nr:hypothetical protein [Gemmatimonadota bacterium]